MKLLFMCCSTGWSFCCVNYIHAELSQRSRQRISAKTMWKTCSVLRKLPHACCFLCVTGSTSGLSQERSLSDTAHQNTCACTHTHTFILTRKTHLYKYYRSFSPSIVHELPKGESVNLALVELFISGKHFRWNVQTPLITHLFIFSNHLA